MTRIRNGLLVAALVLARCASPPPLPLPPPPPPPPVIAPEISPTLKAEPRKLRAALDNTVPREAALVAAPNANAASIALVRQLDGNVRRALAELERDKGRHVTRAAVERAQTAIKDLQNHIAEFHADPDNQVPQP